VLNTPPEGAALCLEAAGDHLALIGDNGKILIFPASELPEMARGKGVKLQSYREGGLRDGLVFDAAEGAHWIDGGGRRRTWTDWREWQGRRGAGGRAAPRGFASNRRFTP
jgi:topoisomerase-4 subunit A